MLDHGACSLDHPLRLRPFALRSQEEDRPGRGASSLVGVWAALKQERINKRLPEAFRPGPKPPEPSLVEQATAEDPLEWPTLVMGAWLANGVLYLLVAIAYYRPFLLGATLLLTAGIVFAVWLVLAVLLHLGLAKLERETDRTIESIRRNAAPQAAPP